MSSYHFLLSVKLIYNILLTIGVVSKNGQICQLYISKLILKSMQTLTWASHSTRSNMQRKSFLKKVLQSFKEPIVIKNRTHQMLRCIRYHCVECRRTNDKRKYRQLKTTKNQCTQATSEDRFQYQIKLIIKFVSKPTSLFRPAASLQQAKYKAKVSQPTATVTPPTFWKNISTATYQLYRLELHPQFGWTLIKDPEL